ncbi:MAG: NUDIX domain-containing protein [Rhizomicrobium sp.]
MPFLHRASLALKLAAHAWRTPVCLGTNAIVERPGGTIVLVRHRYMPGLSFPGGGVAAGEPPEVGIARELKEEIGLVRAAEIEFFGLYTRKVGWTTNVIALYCVRGGEIEFRPSLEISEMVCIDPHAPPEDTSPATVRRLAEFVGTAPVSPYW